MREEECSCECHEYGVKDHCILCAGKDSLSKKDMLGKDSTRRKMREPTRGMPLRLRKYYMGSVYDYKGYVITEVSKKGIESRPLRRKNRSLGYRIYKNGRMVQELINQPEL